MANIFVVDDAVELGVLVKTLLEDENHVITLFADPEEAFARLQNTVPDLIMVDVMMPKMDGYTLCTKLLEDHRLSGVPVIVLTAKSSTREAFKSLPNVVSFLEKPYKKVVLAHMVERALAKAKKDG